MKCVSIVFVLVTSMATAGVVCRENVTPIKIAVAIRPSDQNWVVQDSYTISCPQIKSGPTDSCTFPHTFTVMAFNSLTGKWEEVFANKPVRTRTLACGGSFAASQQNFLGSICSNTNYSKVTIIDNVAGKVRRLTFSCYTLKLDTEGVGGP